MNKKYHEELIKRLGEEPYLNSFSKIIIGNNWSQDDENLIYTILSFYQFGKSEEYGQVRSKIFQNYIPEKYKKVIKKDDKLIDLNHKKFCEILNLINNQHKIHNFEPKKFYSEMTETYSDVFKQLLNSLN